MKFTKCATSKLVLEHKSTTSKIQINLTNLNSGLYFIQAHNDKRTITGIIIKQ